MAPDPPKTEIRQFGDVIEKMIAQMAQRFKNQVLLEMNKSTVDKFTDAQTGNFAKILLSLSSKFRRKLLNKYDNKRIEAMSNKFTSKVNARNQKELYNRIEDKIGISSAELAATEGLTFQINAYKLETSQWVKKMRDETMEQWTANTLRQMAEGDSLETIMSQFDGMVEKRRGHAKMVARTQISTFNSLTSKARSQNLGITTAVWVTARDERTRPCHKARDGKEYELSEGLYSSCDGKTLMPGIDYNCRCIARMKIPEMEGVDNQDL